MLFTVGHSNQTIERFLALLQQHQIEVLADVRSVPASRFTPQFNSQGLQAFLRKHGIKYVWLEELGGRPKEASLYDLEGHADYLGMSQAPSFLAGLERLKTGMSKYRVATMCSEENPNECHRRLLVVKALCLSDSAYAEEIVHIRGGGRLETELELQARDSLKQANWFGEVSQWRSPKPIRLVSQARAQHTALLDVTEGYNKVYTKRFTSLI
jgi:uncharacterized protein (DUF488 family)